MQKPTDRKCVFRGLSLVLLLLSIYAWGCSNTTTPDIAASANTAPVVSSVTASPNIVTRGGTSLITVLASDAEQDDLSYTFIPSGGSIDASGESATWTAPAVAGKYTITVEISDGRQTTEAWVTLTVFVPLTTITGTLIISGDQSGDLADTKVILRAGATEVSQDQLVRYVPTTGSGPRVTFVADDVDPGTYYLEAWQDTDHNTLISNGDYYGRYGNAGAPGDDLPPLALAEGQTRFVLIQMAMIPTIDDGTDEQEYGNDDEVIKDNDEATTDNWADR